MRFFDFFMLLGWPVVTLLVSGLGFYLMRRLFDGLRNRALPAGRTHRLVHSIGAPILGLPALLICGHFALTNFHSGETVAAVMLTFFASLGLLMIAEFIFARHELFDGGIVRVEARTCAGGSHVAEMEAIPPLDIPVRAAEDQERLLQLRCPADIAPVIADGCRRRDLALLGMAARRARETDVDPGSKGITSSDRYPAERSAHHALRNAQDRTPSPP